MLTSNTYALSHLCGIHQKYVTYHPVLKFMALNAHFETDLKKYYYPKLWRKKKIVPVRLRCCREYLGRYNRSASRAYNLLFQPHRASCCIFSLTRRRMLILLLLLLPLSISKKMLRRRGYLGNYVAPKVFAPTKILVSLSTSSDSIIARSLWSSSSPSAVIPFYVTTLLQKGTKTFSAILQCPCGVE